MDDTPKTFTELASQALTGVVASLEHATKPSISSAENDHRRAFVQTFRRWAILFKRKDGNPQDDKWLIAEYYKSLGHLSEAGFDKLTDILKETCVFFPTIKECLDCTRHAQYEWAHPFYNKPHLLRSRAPEPVRLAAPVQQIEHDHG